jgi:hypothetical protein
MDLNIPTCIVRERHKFMATKQSSIKIMLLASITMVILWSISSYLWPQIIYNKPATIFRDDGDFGVYFSGNGWINPNQPLYYEYPVSALLYTNWPRVFTDNFEVYHWLLWTSNALLYVLTGWLLYKLFIKFRTTTKFMWWLWILPSAIFYGLNRFDIFPVFLVILALYLVMTNRLRSGWFVYGFSIMVKLYPIFLLPLFLFFIKEKNKKFSQYAPYVLAPIIALTIGAIGAGGWLATIVPYITQTSRGFEFGSLFSLIAMAWPNIQQYLGLISQLGQILLPILWWLKVVWSKTQLSLFNNITLAAVSLLLVLTFYPFYSNQWWLWVLPFLILVIHPSKWWLVVLYDILNYLQYPIAFKFFWGRGSLEFNLITLARSLVMIVIIGLLWRQLPRGWWRLGLLKFYA